MDDDADGPTPPGAEGEGGRELDLLDRLNDLGLPADALREADLVGAGGRGDLGRVGEGRPTPLAAAENPRRPGPGPFPTPDPGAPPPFPPPPSPPGSPLGPEA